MSTEKNTESVEEAVARRISDLAAKEKDLYFLRRGVEGYQPLNLGIDSKATLGSGPWTGPNNNFVNLPYVIDPSMQPGQIRVEANNCATMDQGAQIQWQATQIARLEGRLEVQEKRTLDHKDNIETLFNWADEAFKRLDKLEENSRKEFGAIDETQINHKNLVKKVSGLADRVQELEDQQDDPVEENFGEYISLRPYFSFFSLFGACKITKDDDEYLQIHIGKLNIEFHKGL